MISTSYKLEPAIWSLGTGQQITWFDRCQLIIIWCHISKKYKENQGCKSLSTYYLKDGRHLARLHHCCRHLRCAYTPTSNTALAMITTRKSIHGFPLVSYMGMGLHCNPSNIFARVLLVCKCFTWLNIPQLKLGNIREYSPIFKTACVAKKIWRIINTIVSIWCKNMPRYLSLHIICSLKLTIFLELRSENCLLLGTDNVCRHIFIFSYQMEAIVYILYIIFTFICIIGCFVHFLWCQLYSRRRLTRSSTGHENLASLTGWLYSSNPIAHQNWVTSRQI